MLLTYVDESYDDDHYWMVALLVAEQHLRPLGRTLDSVVRKAAERYPVEESAELHGHALVQAREDWTRMGNKGNNMIRARIGVYAEAMKAIAEHDVRIIVRGLDVQAHRLRGADSCRPHEIVLRHLLEQIDHHAQGERQLALVIADEIDGADEHRQHFRDYQQDGTGGTLSSTLPRIVDTIHFAPSKASRLLQAADLIAYLHRRLISGQDADSRARKANELLWSHVEPRVVHQQCWAP
ncbi:DUF3800 domain-containing protein [Streptomyces sp. NPDC002730]|uniref:DUF3800 domain-containing protein n=1 Tax=Streptomyces sp. NPDC002730 TaxID=3364662 RepID=UPI0036C81D91